MQLSSERTKVRTSNGRVERCGALPPPCWDGAMRPGGHVRGGVGDRKMAEREVGMVLHSYKRSPCAHPPWQIASPSLRYDEFLDARSSWFPRCDAM